MKKLITAAFLTIILSCNKDQKLISEIAGEYKIESVTNYKNGQGTSVSFTKATIFFADCTMKDGVGSSCTGWYQFDEMPKVTFQYRTESERDFKEVSILNVSNYKAPIIMGYFEFEHKNSFLLLNGIENSGSANGVITTTYSDIKLYKN